MSNTVSKSVVDFFSGRSEIEAQKYTALRQQAETIQEKVITRSENHPIALLFVLFGNRANNILSGQYATIRDILNAARDALG